jgi:hypothetical protein
MDKTLHYMRHHMIRDAVSRIYSSIGAYTDSRCAAYEFVDGKTLDLAIFFTNHSLALDVRVASPTCDSHVLHAQCQLGAAMDGENEKDSKYGGEVRSWAGEHGVLSVCDRILRSLWGLCAGCLQACRDCR